MRAAVTGGAGFIGSNLVDGLVRSGAEVLVVDDLSTGKEANLDSARAAGARLEKLDVRDADAVTAAFTAFAPDVVFHLAAQIDVRVSMAEPAHDAATNVLGSVNVFAAAAAAGARRVVNTSTGGAIYGETDVVPTPETEPARPLSAYGLSKRTAEEYGSWFRQARGLDVVTLRYGNVYGPRQDPAGDAGVIALFCDRILTGRRPLVFGDGRQTRDYVFVGDIVAANLAAAAAEAPAHDRYNVGTGTEVSVLELIAAVAEAAGIDPAAFAPELRPPRAGEVLRSCLDVSRARADLQLAAPTPLADGLRQTLAWVRTISAAR
ncbi:NAD-dependent epimerase/dehydratase family protein [Pseudonocardia sp. H11422]|uniref:NAD-dependent epimerase/dehydratase family protein n=1 Tax=Pseudonocardia sp. H11422 TaxID=2835866 RepID=UPI001BDD4DA0|nr:NAD-dependent epimerase/dehydratase family protein [Pseudonocardia sp. H11422]